MWFYMKYIVKNYSEQMLIVGFCIYKGNISRLEVRGDKQVKSKGR